MKLTKSMLNQMFKFAYALESKYVAVRISIGLNKAEIIINPYENINDKLAYYNNVYDEDLRHKYAEEDIRIIAFAHGESLAEIESKLELYDITGTL